MGSKLKMKRITFFSAIISLLSFIYKVVLGVLNTSNVLIVAATSTLLVFICKLLFVKNVTMTRDKKKKAYLFMCISIFVYALIFIAFTVLKVFGIDASNQKTYEGVIGILFISFILIMFILSIINLKGALEKTDIMVIGLKEMTFVSALADAVIIEEFIYRTVSEYQTIEVLETITKYFPLGIGILMVIVSIFMFIRFARYKAETK